MSAVAFPLLQPKSNKVDDEWTHKNCRLIWSSDIFSTLFPTPSLIGFRFDFLEASISRRMEISGNLIKAEMETWKLPGNVLETFWFLEAILGAWKFRRNFLN